MIVGREGIAIVYLFLVMKFVWELFWGVFFYS
jgi:hypothetical protein